MDEFIQKIRNQLNGLWGNLDKGKKIKLGISSLLILISITGFIVLSTRTNYEVLYKDLSMKDVGLITNKLDEMGIKWDTPKDNENTILVPSEMKNKAKIQLATEGLPKEGYSILDAFNDSSWTMTEYEKKQRIAYAMQKEIAITITEISGIDNATVYIDIPEENAFIKDSGQATASVFVNLAGGMPLNNEKVVAIKNLVAGSFKELGVENVAIIDDSGKAYVDNDSSDTEYGLNDQLNLQQNFQIKLNASIKRFLENFYGYGNVDVRTNVKIDFNSEITNIVEFSPPIEGSDEGLIRSMEQVEEHSTGGESNDVSGVESNSDDTTDYATTNNSTEKYTNMSKIINYELNEINRQIKKMPGGIESVSAAIIINEESIADGELTDDKRKEIEELIFAVTGLETETVKVSSGKFNNNIINNIDNEFSGSDSAKSNTLYWAIGLLGLALIGSIGFNFVKKDKKSNDNINEIIPEEEEIEEIDFEKGKSGFKSQVENFVGKKPEAVAQLLRSWLNEE